MDIVWRRQAARDLEHRLRLRPPARSRRSVEPVRRIEGRVAQLGDHPYIGRPSRVAGTRELVVAGTPYVVAYRVARSRVDVLAVIHASRR